MASRRASKKRQPNPTEVNLGAVPAVGMDPPVIAIVGRPNVGKSTIFNRMTGRRTALVSDLPGLTRDRREGEAMIGQTVITLIDTAGLEAAVKGSIAARMRGQTERAIAQADLVLFVVDAKDGLTATDRDFARVVRASGRPVVVVANKIEGRGREAGQIEAYELGLGEPVGVSAEHGMGFGELEADIANALGIVIPPPAKRRSKRERVDDANAAAVAAEDAPDDSEPLPGEPPRAIRVAIVGRPNAGKSTLVNTLVGEDRMLTGPEPGLTRDSIATDIDWKGRGFRLYDTAGLRRKSRIEETAEKLSASDAIRAIRFAEVVVLLMDASAPLEHQDLTIAELVEKEGRALVVAVNKWDLVQDKQQRLTAIRAAARLKFSEMPGVAVVPVSATAEIGIERMMEAVVVAFEIWNKRIPTGQLNRWLMEALGRHAPPATSGRRIKLRFMTQPSVRPPTFVAFCSKPGNLPDSYIKYLTNSLRDAFDLPGVPIRFHLRKNDNPFVERR